jgi:hypothetical protein
MNLEGGDGAGDDAENDDAGEGTSVLKGEATEPPSAEEAAKARSERISLIRARGYSEAFVSNAQRMVATFSRAADFLRLVGDLWESDQAADLTIEEKRLAEIDGAIREGRKSFERALELLDTATVVAPQPLPYRSFDPKADVN